MYSIEKIIDIKGEYTLKRRNLLRIFLLSIFTFTFGWIIKKESADTILQRGDAGEVIGKNRELDTDEIKLLMGQLTGVAINVKNFGAVADGIHDDSEAIRKAIFAMPKNGGVLLFPPGTYIQGDGTNPSYIIDRTTGQYSMSQEENIGRDIRFLFTGYRNFRIVGYGATIKAHPNNSTIINNSGFTFDGCENGLIEGLTYYGSIETRHPNGGDSWKFNSQNGLAIRDSKNLVLKKLTFDNCVMDGFNVGGNSEDIKLYDCRARYCYRQGISLTDTTKVKLYDCEASYTGAIYGTAPMAGLDIEPNNSNNEYLQEIVIENLKTKNNVSGIQIYAEFIGNLTNTISITIRNHVDKYSDYGFNVVKYIPNVKGLIKLENCEWESKIPFNVADWASTGPRIEAHDCTAICSKEIGVTAYAFRVIKGDLVDEPRKTLGNVHLYRPNIIVKKGGVAPDRSIYLDCTYAKTLANVSIVDPINMPATISQFYANKPMENIMVSDKFKTLTHSLSRGTMSVNGSNYKRYYDNSGATDVVNFYLATTTLIGKTLTFTNKTGTTLIVTQTAEMKKPIYPTKNAKGVSSTQKGATITLVCTQDGYFISKKIGDWVEIA